MSTVQQAQSNQNVQQNAVVDQNESNVQQTQLTQNTEQTGKNETSIVAQAVKQDSYENAPSTSQNPFYSIGTTNAEASGFGLTPSVVEPSSPDFKGFGLTPGTVQTPDPAVVERNQQAFGDAGTNAANGTTINGGILEAIDQFAPKGSALHSAGSKLGGGAFGNYSTNIGNAGAFVSGTLNSKSETEVGKLVDGGANAAVNHIAGSVFPITAGIEAAIGTAESVTGKDLVSDDVQSFLPGGLIGGFTTSGVEGLKTVATFDPRHVQERHQGNLEGKNGLSQQTAGAQAQQVGELFRSIGDPGNPTTAQFMQDSRDGKFGPIQQTIQREADSAAGFSNLIKGASDYVINGSVDNVSRAGQAIRGGLDSLDIGGNISNGAKAVGDYVTGGLENVGNAYNQNVRKPLNNLSNGVQQQTQEFIEDPGRELQEAGGFLKEKAQGAWNFLTGGN
ncbi:MAG: hypothetical protein AAF772_11465 [Acidobacteriota bacterium]